MLFIESYGSGSITEIQTALGCKKIMGHPVYPCFTGWKQTECIQERKSVN